MKIKRVLFVEVRFTKDDVEQALVDFLPIAIAKKQRFVVELHADGTATATAEEKQ